MNENQKRLCILLVCVIVGMGIYPPFELAGINWGHDWLFRQPLLARVDTATLMTEWLGALIVGAILFFLLKSRW